MRDVLRAKLDIEWNFSPQINIQEAGVELLSV